MKKTRDSSHTGTGLWTEPRATAPELPATPSLERGKHEMIRTGNRGGSGVFENRPTWVAIVHAPGGIKRPASPTGREESPGDGALGQFNSSRSIAAAIVVKSQGLLTFELMPTSRD